MLQFEVMASCRLLLMASLFIVHSSAGQGQKGSLPGSTESSDGKLAASLGETGSGVETIRPSLGESGSEVETTDSGSSGSNGGDEVGIVMEKVSVLLEQVKDGLHSQSEDQKAMIGVLDKLLKIEQQAFAKTEVKDLLKELLDFEKKVYETSDLKDTLKELVRVQKMAYEDTQAQRFEDLTGIKAQAMRAKEMADSDGANDKEIFHIFEQKERDPEAALGFLRLDRDYNADEAPNGVASKVKAWLEPTFVADIDCMARRMGLEMKVFLMWEDERIIWRMNDSMYPGVAFQFHPSIVRYV